MKKLQSWQSPVPALSM
jgi:hypothetical protein